MSGLLARRLRSCYSISCRSRRFFFAPNCGDHLWGHPTSCSVHARVLFAGGGLINMTYLSM